MASEREYAITVTFRITATSEGEARNKLGLQVPLSYTINSIGPVHTAGTTCSLCGQHHTAQSARQLNDGSAPRDVTQRVLETGCGA